MIIPIIVPKGQGGDSSSMDKIEWVMLELNGELVKPQQDNAVRNTAEAEQNNSDKRRVELGSVQFDDTVSLYVCILSVF
jgi:hypothetical protein